MTLKLKKITLKDVNSRYLSWLKDKEVFYYSDQSKIKQTIKKIKKYVKDRLDGNEKMYGIFYKKNHIGNIKLGPIDYINLSSEISYFIGEKNLWNKGLATKAIIEIIKIAKKKGIKKLIAACQAPNLGSIKVLKKNKFLKEGLLKKHQILGNKKKRTDVFIYGKIL